jgi:hypothetical protein
MKRKRSNSLPTDLSMQARLSQEEPVVLSDQLVRTDLTKMSHEDQIEYLLEILRQRDEDLTLAAEIGQQVLQEHERLQEENFLLLEQSDSQRNQITELENLRHEMRGQLSSSEGQLQDLRMESSEYGVERVQLLDENAYLRENLRLSEERNRALISEKKKASSEIDNLKDQLEKFTETYGSIVHADEYKVSLEQQNAKLLEEMRKLEKQSKKQSGKIHEQINKLAAQKQMLEISLQDTKRGKITKLDSEISAKHQEIDDLRLLREDEARRLFDLQSKTVALEQKQAELDKINEQIAKSQEELSSISQQNQKTLHEQSAIAAAKIGAAKTLRVMHSEQDKLAAQSKMSAQELQNQREEIQKLQDTAKRFLFQEQDIQQPRQAETLNTPKPQTTKGEDLKKFLTEILNQIPAPGQVVDSHISAQIINQIQGRYGEGVKAPKVTHKNEKKQLAETLFWAVEKIEKHEKYKSKIDLRESSTWGQFKEIVKRKIAKFLGNDKYTKTWIEKASKRAEKSRDPGLAK